MCTKLSISQRNWILCGICSIPLILGTSSLALGIWLSVVVLHNASLPADQQLYFEKVTAWTTEEGGGGEWGGKGGVVHLDNESPFTHTPVDNLCFYLLTLSFITILGGSGRVIATSFFCVHLCRKRLTSQLFWAWLVLSILAVTIEVLVTYDILHTLSHNDVAPPYQRDFFFTNDTQNFYWLCHTLRIFIWFDIGLGGLAQCAVCAIYRVHAHQSQFV